MTMVPDSRINRTALPRIVVFEGVDGTGKTTLSRLLAEYYRLQEPQTPLITESFPGSRSGTLGELIYRLHHNNAPGMLQATNIAPAALQLLHVAAHVDNIANHIAPALHMHGSNLILDRYWWSTYAYVRRHLAEQQAWDIVNAERGFWKELPKPLIIYLRREVSLKRHEIDEVTHRAVDRYYQEVIAEERRNSTFIAEIDNSGSLQQTWAETLSALKLPFDDIPTTE